MSERMLVMIEVKKGSAPFPDGTTMYYPIDGDPSKEWLWIKPGRIIDWERVEMDYTYPDSGRRYITINPPASEMKVEGEGQFGTENMDRWDKFDQECQEIEFEAWAKREPYIGDKAWGIKEYRKARLEWWLQMLRCNKKVE